MKPTKSEKLKTSTSKEDKSTTEHTDEPQPSQPPVAPEEDPKMPPLEDVDTPQKKFKFKNPASTVKPKHFQKKLFQASSHNPINFVLPQSPLFRARSYLSKSNSIFSLRQKTMLCS